MLRQLLTRISLSANIHKDKSEQEQTDVYIHIGAPKAGSSAIQKFMVENSKKLTKHGFYYPRHKLDKNGISGGHGLLARCLIDGNEARAREIFEQYLGEAKSLKCVLVLSAEGFWGQVEGLQDLLKNVNAKYFAYYRHPLDSLLSNYNQLVKRHFGKISLKKYAEMNLEAPGKGVTGEVLLEWKKCVGSSLDVLPYPTKDQDTATIVEEFLSFLGLSKDNFSITAKVVNRSYPPEILEFKRLVNFVLTEKDRNINVLIDRDLQALSDSGKSQVILSTPQSTYLKLKEFSEITSSSIAAIEKAFAIKIRSDVEDSLNNTESRLSLEPVVSSYSKMTSYQDVFLKVKGRLETGERTYEVFKLAELLNLECERHQITDRLFDTEAYNGVLDDKAEIADILRNLAVLYERNEKKHQAYELISAAYKRRPHGIFIAKMHDRLKKELNIS